MRGGKTPQQRAPRPPRVPWPPRTVADYCAFQRYALACTLVEPWIHDRMLNILETAMLRHYAPVHLPPWQVFPFRGTYFGGDRTATSIPATATWTDLLEVTMPTAATGVVRYIAHSVDSSEAWEQLQWRIQLNGQTVPGFGADPLDANATWRQQWANLDDPLDVHIIIPEKSTLTFQAFNLDADTAFNAFALWRGWYWPQRSARQDGPNAHREP